MGSVLQTHEWIHYKIAYQDILKMKLWELGLTYLISLLSCTFHSKKRKHTKDVQKLIPKKGHIQCGHPKEIRSTLQSVYFSSEK